MGKIVNWLLVIALVFGISRYVQMYMIGNELEGKPFPDFAVVSLDEKESTFHAEFEGPVLAAFWSVGCIPCQIELGRFQKAIANGEIDFEDFVAINVGNTKKEIIQYMKKQGYSFDVVMDIKAEGFKKLGVKSVPTVFHLRRGLIINSVLSGISPLGIIRGQKFIIDFSK